MTLLQWVTRPQTEDATVRANVVGIAPPVIGHIVELRVRDNQQVQEGDLLFFLIDPRPYEIALERARAALALTRKEVDGLKKGAATALAGVSRAEAQLDASWSFAYANGKTDSKLFVPVGKPVLANIYLNVLDTLWKVKKVQERLGARLVRYADEFPH